MVLSILIKSLYDDLTNTIEVTSRVDVTSTNGTAYDVRSITSDSEAADGMPSTAT